MANLKLPELDTRNVLHVVKENFERVKLKTYAIRIIYAGEHALTKEEIAEKFRKSVHYANMGYVTIPVHGILLVYDSYFVHILEGSEDMLFRQLRFIFNIEASWLDKMRRFEEEAAAAEGAAEQPAEEAAEELAIFYEDEPAERPERVMFRKLKMLMIYHNITTLRFAKWHAVFGKPPSLVGNLDVYGPLSEHMEQLGICLDKIDKLCKLAHDDENLSFEGLSANDPKMEALPEVALLDFLLQSQYTLDLRELFARFRRVDDYIFYFEQVWPLPTAFTPRNLYKLKIDDSFVEPLPVMPWEMKQDDEDREDRQSSSSD